MQTDLSTYRNTVSLIQKELRRVESEENIWLESFESSRSQLTTTIDTYSTTLDKLKKDGKSLHALNIQECGLTKSRRTTHMADIMKELLERDENIEESIIVYESLISEAHTTISTMNHSQISSDIEIPKLPICSITIDDTDI